MEQIALRPKPLPGRDPGGTDPVPDPDSVPERAPAATRRPHAARRRGRQLVNLLFVLFVGLVLVLAGVGLGTVGATVVGMSRLAEVQRQAAQQPPGATNPGGPTRGGQAPGGPAPGGPASVGPGAGRTSASAAAEAAPAPGSAPAPVGPTLGVEVVDAGKPGARVVGVHVPGPGYTAGLVRGDLLLTFGRTRIDTAADLARAVSRARPGGRVKLVVRHESGAYQQLTVVPGVVT